MKLSENSEYLTGLAALYRRLGAYSLAPLQPVPGTALTMKAVKVLAHTPLRDLKGTFLEEIAEEILIKWGSPNDFKHLLPRFLEVIVQENSIGKTHKEVVLGKLKSSVDFEHWPPPDVDAVSNFLTKSWQAILDDDTGFYLDSTAEFFSYFQDFLDWKWLLLQWLQSKSLTSMRSMHEFIDLHFRKVMFRQEELGAGSRLSDIVSVLKQKNAPERFRRIAADNGPSELADLLMISADQIEILTNYQGG